AWTDEALGASSAQIENLNLYTSSEMIKRRGLLLRVAGDLAGRGAWIPDLGPPAAAHRAGFAWLGQAVAQLTQGIQSAHAAQAAPAGARPRHGPGLDLAALGPAATDACVLQLGEMISVRPVQDTRLVDVAVQYTDPEVARTIADRLVLMFADEQRARVCAAD